MTNTTAKTTPEKTADNIADKTEAVPAPGEGENTTARVLHVVAMSAEGQTARIYLSDGSQLGGVTGLDYSASAATGGAEITIKALLAVPASSSRN